MYRHSQEPITPEEKDRLAKVECCSLVSRFFGKRGEVEQEGGAVEYYELRVEQCFVPENFNEELPLYLLDLGGLILVLFGQWMFDPHTLIAPKGLFEMWKSEAAFFGSFTMRCHARSGTVFRLAVQESVFQEAERLSSVLKFKELHECQFVEGHGATLIEDLMKGGLIESL